MRKRRHIGNTCVPDDLLHDGIVFDDDAQARRDDEAYRKACQDLDRKWQAVKRAGEEIERSWRAEAIARLEAAAVEIDRDRKKQLMDDLAEEERQLKEADDRRVAQYLESLAAIVKRRNDAWLVEAKKRLDRATRSINKDIARKERELFLRRR
jgi:hypothetical protein